MHAFVVYEPAERNFHILYMSRTQNTETKFNWLHFFFTWLFLYHEEVTRVFPAHQTLHDNFLINEIGDAQFYRKLKYANLVEQNSILTLSYRATRSWSLCTYFFKCCFLLDTVREKYSYVSHATLHFICMWPRTF